MFWWVQANTDLLERAGAQLAITATAVRNQLSGEPGIKASANSPEQAGQRIEQPLAQSAPPAPPEAASSAVPITAESQGTSAHALPKPRPPNQAATQAAAAPPLARIELATDTLEILPLQPVASVVVHRRRNYHNGVSFSWWTESGTAIPGQDFVPVKARMDFIPAGENETHLLVPIVADPRRHLAKSFYVVVGDPSDDAALGPRTITMVTIPAAN
jgi:hypothetical protein